MPYKPANQAGADSAYYDTLGGLTKGNQGTYDTASKGFQDAYQKISTNPYNEAAQTGVNAASKDAFAAGSQGIADANHLGSFAPMLEAFGFDPNFDNFNHGMQGATDMQQVLNARSGVAGSPFGAGATGDAGAAFTRQWNADRYGKAQSALQALGQLFSTRQDMAGTGAQQEGAAALAPMQTSNDINFANIQALQALVDGLGAAGKPLQGDVSQYGDYLKLGQSSTQIAADVTKQNNANPGILGGLGAVFGLASNFIPGMGGASGLLSLFGKGGASGQGGSSSLASKNPTKGG